MNQGATLVVLIALFFAADTPAVAQTCAAKTCSEALHACAGKHCAAMRGGNCRPFCQNEFDRCMRTGEFRGRVCHKKKLIKQ